MPVTLPAQTAAQLHEAATTLATTQREDFERAMSKLTRAEQVAVMTIRQKGEG